MGSFIQHVFFGILSALVVGVVLFQLGLLDLTQLSWPILGIVVFVFSVIADIDARSSIVARLFHVVFAIIITLLLAEIFVLNLFWIIVLVVMGVFELYYIIFSRSGFDHRQFPHSYTFLVLLLFFLYFLTNTHEYLIFATVGFLSHLVLDNHVFSALVYDWRFWRFKKL